GSYSHYFKIGNQPYILFNSSIASIDISNGVITNLTDLPLPKNTLLDFNYVYNGKMRYRHFLSSEVYEFDPANNSILLLGTFDNKFRILRSHDAYFSVNDQAIHHFDPATRSHSQIELLPSNGLFGFRFSVDGKLYFELGPTNMVNYDPN
ncbi:MAG: hypothetical protein AAFX87_14205, partial [Bacteroidota bacterium]